MSGYTHCGCRDCFETTIGEPGKTLCFECRESGCDAQNGECLRPDAYGVEEEEE